MRSRPLFAFLALLLAATVLLASCGGDDDGGGDDDTVASPTPAATDADDDGSEATPTPDGASSGDQEIDACTLITQDEAEAALGAPVGEGTRSDFPPFYSCEYEGEGFLQLTVTVLIYPGSDDAEAAYDLVMDINDYPTIDGIGDRAYDTQPIGDVTAQQGKYEISVDIITADDAADFEVAKDLAKTVLARLP